jgi:hypothetical protein
LNKHVPCTAAISANSLSFHETQPQEKYWPYPIACFGIFKLFTRSAISAVAFAIKTSNRARSCGADNNKLSNIGSVARKYVCALFAAASLEFQLNATLEILSIEHTAAGDLYNTHI